MAESTTRAILIQGDRPDTTDDELVRLAGAFIATKTSPNTRHAYRTDLHQWFRWCRANSIDPLAVMRTHCEVYARHLEDRGLAPATRQRRIGTVRGWYEWLIDDGHWTGANPVRKVKQPQATPVTERAALTKREMHILLKAAEADHPTSHAMVALGYLNGLRIGEMTAANISDLGKVGWHHTLHIRGKGEKHDQVPIPPACYAAVERAIAGRDSGPILTAKRTGKRLARWQATEILNRLCRREGITRITPHGLRRTAITLLFQEGVPPREVQLFARHESLNTTIRYDARARALDEHHGATLIRAIA